MPSAKGHCESPIDPSLDQQLVLTIARVIYWQFALGSHNYEELAQTFGAQIDILVRRPYWWTHDSRCLTNPSWWPEKGECYVISVDTLHRLEQLIAAPNRFSVEEKNRIRRNLEGFHPQTVSKAKPDSEEFFKIIMGFPNPKRHNIEKDVKVFPWKILESALQKIIGKYSVDPGTPAP
ncbi:hypothetical protein FOMG_19560 [Fusarium oxysporum f. sp. melonis 26406]|uniref:DUF7082 domain-containing protein n=1 Tax=Fusarium oxysporum f. sp. melonis 26406 TaxID=1089452 RepID=W9Z4Y8_FUSOX|nr:hypothetical protein FOMG_19560 [Fusarium oxysporum f. sp. melonis 26406]